MLSAHPSTCCPEFSLTFGWQHGVSDDSDIPVSGVNKAEREPIKLRTAGKIQAQGSPGEADHGLEDVVARGSAALVKHELMLLEDTDPRQKCNVLALE